MKPCSIRKSSIRKSAFTAAAAALVLGAGAPAVAGGYYGGHYGYHHGYYGKHHYGHHRHYRHRHYKRGGGGKAAAIALGVIGGAIILNEIAEDKARRRYEDERYVRYDRYRTYDPNSSRAYPRRYEPPVREEAVPEDGNLSDDDLESRLDGGPEPIRISVESAYQACTRHARNALSDRGYILSAPASPDTAEDLGRAWKMTATVLAEDRRGDSWSRAMYCEADEGRVYLLELI